MLLSHNIESTIVSVSGTVDLNRKNVGGWTALMYACYIGHDDVVNLLLDAAVSVNVRNHKGQSPLILAASCGNESVAYFLLQVGLIKLTLCSISSFITISSKGLNWKRRISAAGQRFSTPLTQVIRTW
jgi:ankyrin repeat protein